MKTSAKHFGLEVGP